MDFKYKIGDNVYCIMNTNIPSESDIFGKWVILYGEVTNQIETKRNIPAYEVRIKKELRKKFYKREYILLYEERIYEHIDDLKTRLLKELEITFENEKTLLSDYIDYIKKEGIRGLIE